VVGLAVRQDHDLAAGFVLLHAAMRLDDLIELEDLADLDGHFLCGDLLNEIFEAGQHEVFGTAVIGRQAHGARNHVHRAEIVKGPLQQSNAEVILELGDPTTDRRDRHAEETGRHGEALRFDDLREYGKGIEVFHRGKAPAPRRWMLPRLRLWAGPTLGRPKHGDKTGPSRSSFSKAEECGLGLDQFVQSCRKNSDLPNKSRLACKCRVM